MDSYRDLLSGDFDEDGLCQPYAQVPRNRWPKYVESLPDGSYRCMWCDGRSLTCAETLEMHLRGKEHTKRCANSSIPPYGSDGHFTEANRYVAEYGHDPYARLKHWPQCIVEEGMFYVCRCCGSRKYQTQRAVNDHLAEQSHIHRAGRFDDESPVRQAVASSSPALAGTRYDSRLDVMDITSGYASTSSVEPVVTSTSPMYSSPADAPPAFIGGPSWMEVADRTWPTCIIADGDGYHWRCTVCSKKFNCNAGVDAHLVHPKHISRMSYAASSSWSKAYPSAMPSGGVVSDALIAGPSYNRTPPPAAESTASTTTDVLKRMLGEMTSVGSADTSAGIKRPVAAMDVSTDEIPANTFLSVPSGLDPLRQRALEKQRLERLATFVNLDRKECYLCERKFDAMHEVDQHLDDLGHIASWYQYTIDGIA